MRLVWGGLHWLFLQINWKKRKLLKDKPIYIVMSMSKKIVANKIIYPITMNRKDLSKVIKGAINQYTSG